MYHKEKPFEVTKRNGVYKMIIQLPFADKEKVDLWVKEGELTIRVDNVKRCIQLPRSLAGREIKRAKLENGQFVITFEGGKR